MGGHLISRDELLAAGALDVPPEWRKSLQAGLPKPKGPQRELFADDGDADAQASADSQADDADEQAADQEDSADDPSADA